MNELKCKFDLVDPEFKDDSVVGPQINVFYRSLDKIVVIVYFMATVGIDQFEGSANSALGTVTLECIGTSSTGAVAASVTLQKVIYTFENTQGMARNFVFNYTTT